MKPVPFMVLGSQRTGSTLIRTSLDHHPRLKCSGEVFLFPGDGEDSYPRYLSASTARTILHYLWRSRPVFSFLDLLYSRPGYDAVGFKFMYSQARWAPYRVPMVLDYARRHKVRIIHVTRANVLKTYISRVTSKATGIYHSEAGKVEREPVKLPVESLIRDLEKIQKEDERWEQRLLRYTCIKVVYEDFVNSTAAESRRLLSFLGIDEETVLFSPHQKVNPDSLEQVVSNYEQVYALLNSSAFAWCLD